MKIMPKTPKKLKKANKNVRAVTDTSICLDLRPKDLWYI